MFNSPLFTVSNLDLESLVTPVDANKLIALLEQANYEQSELIFLKQGFTKGFTIGYQGPKNRQDTSKNIPFTIGNKYDMWEKIMKEARVAGPFENIPFHSYIQSPIGLVPKAGNKTRLIFHLSYNFSDKPEQASLNQFTPKELCTVKYNDLDCAVRACLRVSQAKKTGLQGGNMGNMDKSIYLAKSDLISAFRMLPIKKEHWCWLILKAEDPRDGKVKFFVDKCLPFGASISCSHFQRFSDALRFLVEYITGKQMQVINYLDDYLFIETTSHACNSLVSSFLNLCNDIRLSVSLEKTEWACEQLVFLGILLDGRNLMLSIPAQKRQGINTIEHVC